MYLDSVSSASRKAAEYGLSGHSITAEAQYTMSDAQSYIHCTLCACMCKRV